MVVCAKLTVNSFWSALSFIPSASRSPTSPRLCKRASAVPFKYLFAPSLFIRPATDRFVNARSTQINADYCHLRKIMFQSIDASVSSSRSLPQAAVSLWSSYRNIRISASAHKGCVQIVSSRFHYYLQTASNQLNASFCSTRSRRCRCRRRRHCFVVECCCRWHYRCHRNNNNNSLSRCLRFCTETRVHNLIENNKNLELINAQTERRNQASSGIPFTLSFHSRQSVFIQ